MPFRPAAPRLLGAQPALQETPPHYRTRHTKAPSPPLCPPPSTGITQLLGPARQGERGVGGKERLQEAALVLGAPCRRRK